VSGKKPLKILKSAKRFNHFVNAPEEKDPSVKFDEMREMKKAKEWK
jgi:nitrite reductase (NADH) large subunit